MVKRIIRVIILSLLMLLVIGLPVLAAGYQATITVINANAATYTNLPVILAQDNTYLAANGYTSYSMLDVNIKDNGVSVPFMPADDKTLFVLTTLDNNSTSQLIWSSNNVPITYFPIITGQGGYITVPDNATLELGDNFEIEWSGYIDTANGSNKDIYYKQDAFRLYVSSAGNISASILGSGDAPVYTVSAALATGIHTITVTLATNVLTIATT